MSTRARENSKKLIICKERLNRLFEELDQLCVGPDMTVGSFLGALRRFIARRGRPQLLRSDNFQTFHLASRFLKPLFINERAPWCGGYWECLVRSIKVALSKVIGRCHAKPDELHTVLCEMEARINGRPLTTVSDIPDGQLALTQALFLPKICQKPKLVPNVHRLKHLTPLQLADIHYKAWEKGGTRRCSFDLRMDHSGQMTKEKREPTSFSHSVKVLYAKVDEQLDEAIRKFWEIETIGMMDDSDKADIDSTRAVQNFESTLQFDGIRYTVRLPWLEDDAQLPNNYHQAVSRLQQIERSLKNDPRKAAHYERGMREYLEEDFVEEVTDRTGYPGRIWYLPHHAVIREDKTTTKCRIVFDGSAQYGGVTLNQHLDVGPALQNDLVKVLLRFRRFRIGLQADISKMFLQIGLNEQDRDVCRFLWRSRDVQEAPRIYRFKRVEIIRQLTSPVLWRHCPTKNNPADLLSRGSTVKQLASQPPWWHGPPWLMEDKD
ncbi:hypothetical protein T08_12499 [Trichinella sp. T8]|nr:hypothetical protein T08_12499 [Trichinella sp. T8]